MSLEAHDGDVISIWAVPAPARAHFSNEIILLIKATSLAPMITILEVTADAKQIIAATYQPIEVFLIAGAIYLTINFLVTRAIMLVEYSLNPHQHDAAGKRREVIIRQALRQRSPYLTR